MKTILIPKHIVNNLNSFTDLAEEVMGDLVCQYFPNERLYVVGASFMTGAGSPGSVASDPERLRVLNEFYNQNRDYKRIEFHTHSKGTLRMFGDYYGSNFSQQDLTNINEGLRDNPEYIAMLITPYTKVIKGQPGESFYTITNDNEATRAVMNETSQKMSNLESRLGVNLPNFNLHRLH